MKRVLILALWISTGTIQAQYLKIDNGIVFSSFYNKKDLPILIDNISSYSVGVGGEYFEKNHFSLSSQIGYMRIGGEETNPDLPDEEYSHIVETNEYISINTTFRLQAKSSESRVFVGIGPSVNFMTGKKDFDSGLYEEWYQFEDAFLGAKAELGLTHDIKKFRFGVVGAYLFNLTPTAQSENLSLNNHTFSIALTTGYRIWQ